jgi:hypothetical protein
MEKAKFELGDLVCHVAGDYMARSMAVIGVGPMTTYEGTAYLYQVSLERDGQVTRMILAEYELRKYSK